MQALQGSTDAHLITWMLHGTLECILEIVSSRSRADFHDHDSVTNINV